MAAPADVSRCLLPQLREQAQQLVRRQPQEAKHEVAHHLGVASDPDLPATEFILEARIRTLSLAAFLVALLLRRVKLDFLAPARVVINERHMPQTAAVAPNLRAVIGLICPSRQEVKLA